MSRGRTKHVALIIKRSAYDRAMGLPDDRLHGLLASGDPTVANVMSAHDAHVSTAAEVKKALLAENVEVTRVRTRD